MKKEEPYRLSLIVNFVRPYSKNCSQLKKIPKDIARYIILTMIDWYPVIIARCAATMATPEQRSTIVLTSGSINGSNTSISLIPTGGQTPPIAMEGDKAPWKKDQKNGKNSIASDTKNRSMPYLSASCTLKVWCPPLRASIIRL